MGIDSRQADRRVLVIASDSDLAVYWQAVEAARLGLIVAVLALAERSR